MAAFFALAAVVQVSGPAPKAGGGEGDRGHHRRRAPSSVPARRAMETRELAGSQSGVV